MKIENNDCENLLIAWWKVYLVNTKKDEVFFNSNDYKRLTDSIIYDKCIQESVKSF